MDLEIQGVKYKVTDVTREHLEKKAERFSRFEVIRLLKIVITKESTGYTVELAVTFNWGGDPVFISSQDEELWPLIDIVFDKADVKISREKDKHNIKA